MRYPILYKSNETDFFAMGLGPIEMLKATVTQERNGIFIFEGEILTDNLLFPLVSENCIIKADADHLLKDQRFRIKRIVPNHNGKATIYAEHVSYLSRDLTIKPEVNITGSAQTALNQWKASIVESNPFVVSSDITTSASTKWRIDKVSNPMMALGGVEGSILDRWGGEYLFDNYHISLLKKRGKTATNILAYGRNITDFEQERNILSTYTSIAPYAIYTDGNDKEVIVTVDGYVVDSEHVNKFPNRVTKPIDFSSEFGSGEIPTKARLTTLAQQYIADNEIGVPATSIKISFLDLSQTADYADYAFLEQVNLCDDVRVHYPKLGVNTIAKVVRVVWNVLTESYDEIEIGQKRMSLASQIQEQNKVIQEINTQVNQSQVSADGKNMIFYGLYGENGLGEPNAIKIGDSWFKPNGLETELYVWTGIEWKLIMSTSSFNEINETIKDLDGELELATTAANDAVNKAGQAIRDAGFANSAITAANGQIASLERNLNGFQQVVQDTYANKATVTALATQWTQTTELANGHTSAINSLGDTLNLRVTTDDFKKSMGLKNLIVNSGNLQNTLGWDGEVVLAKHVFYKNNTANLFCIRNATTGEKTARSSYFNILPSTEYTLKFTGFAGGNVKDMDVWILSRKKGSVASYDKSKLLITTNLSPRGVDTRTITFTTNDTDDQAYLRFDNNGSTNGNESLLFFVDVMLVKGSVAPNDWFGAESDDIITQINLSPESLLIASKKIHIDGETYITNGTIKNAHIADLAVDGAKIANATIASAKIISLDVSKLSGQTITGINYQNPFSFSYEGKTYSGTTVINNGGINQNASATDGTPASFRVTAGEVSTQIGDRTTNIYPGRIRFTRGTGERAMIFYSDEESLLYVNGQMGSGLGAYRNYNGEEQFTPILKVTTDWQGTSRIIANARINAQRVHFANGGTIYDSGDTFLMGTEQNNINVSIKSTQLLALESDDLRLNNRLIANNAVRIRNYNGQPMIQTMINKTGVLGHPTTWLSEIYVNAMRGETLNIGYGETDSSKGDLRVDADANGGRLVSNAVYNRTSSNPSNVGVTSYGMLYRVTSAKKYKTDIVASDMSHANKVLFINPKNWIDKNGVYPGRQYGFIADEFDELGLTEVVQYGADGQVEGLAYDRISMYHNVILQDHEKEISSLKTTMSFDIWQLKNEIKELKNEIDSLRQAVV